MRIVQENIDAKVVQTYLKFRNTGLLLSCPAQEYTVFRILLDSTDIHKLVLWWQHKEHTDGKSNKVTDAAPTAIKNPRIKRIIDGEPAKGWLPLDIRNAPNFELVLESNSREGVFLNIIDGNHRAIARQITGQDFQDIPAFLCIHPRIRPWT